jgi:hypothetical protein
MARTKNRAVKVHGNGDYIDLFERHGEVVMGCSNFLAGAKHRKQSRMMSTNGCVVRLRQ